MTALILAYGRFILSLGLGVFALAVAWAAREAVLIIRALRAIRDALTPQPEIGDDVLAMLCPCCDGQPYLECDCTGDCGRRHCKWATLIGDAQFTRELRALLDADGEQA